MIKCTRGRAIGTGSNGVSKNSDSDWGLEKAMTLVVVIMVVATGVTDVMTMVMVVVRWS